MAASTQIITDLQTAETAGGDATTTANAIAAAGPIQDVGGMLTNAVIHAQELRKLLLELDTVVDAGDGFQTQIRVVLYSFD